MILTTVLFLLIRNDLFWDFPLFPLKAEKSNIFFKPVKVQINPNTPHLADIKPSRYCDFYSCIHLFTFKWPTKTKDVG